MGQVLIAPTNSKILVPDCEALEKRLLDKHNLIIASNRGPFTIQTSPEGDLIFQRGGGGLVTALMGLARQVKVTWIASPISEEDRQWDEGEIPVGEGAETIQACYIHPDESAYDGYYNTIANPLLWFLQHSMWDFAHAPTITHSTWIAWDHGYVEVNRRFAEEITRHILACPDPSLVLLQDYHLYLTPQMIRKKLRRRHDYILSHFIHIPWPGPEDWGVLPMPMRRSILEGLCGVDLLGFQTREDSLNFIRTCESYLPDGHVNYRLGRVRLGNHITHVRDFPISVDVDALRELGNTDEVSQYRDQLLEQAGNRRLIVRVDRTEPSKNIVRGFQAFDELLEEHPEHKEKVQFLALLVPSRLEVEEYQSYLDELMAAAGRVNARHGTSEWEPVRVMVGESYPRAVAALQLYDVLLVNPVADGMNLVAKEGPVLNKADGVIVLSERAGAHQQLSADALVISPCDVYATAIALHEALMMPEHERKRRAKNLRSRIEQEDLAQWLCWQLTAIHELKLWEPHDT